MENIFEGAKFGDKFLTKNNKVALYIGIINIDNKEHAQLYVNKTGVINYELSGKLYDFCNSLLDIVSKYQESVDEETLREKAYEWTNFVNTNDLTAKVLAVECAILGYHKAKEE